MFKHIAFTYLSQKTDTSLENRAGRWLLSRGCLLLVGETQATQQPNSTTQYLEVPFCAVSELTTEMRKANSRYGKEVSEVKGAVWLLTWTRPQGRRRAGAVDDVAGRRWGPPPYSTMSHRASRFPGRYRKA